MIFQAAPGNKSLLIFKEGPPESIKSGGQGGGRNELQLCSCTFYAMDIESGD